MSPFCARASFSGVLAGQRAHPAPLRKTLAFLLFASFSVEASEIPVDGPRAVTSVRASRNRAAGARCRASAAILNLPCLSLPFVALPPHAIRLSPRRTKPSSASIGQRLSERLCWRRASRGRLYAASISPTSAVMQRFDGLSTVVCTHADHQRAHRRPTERRCSRYCRRKRLSRGRGSLRETRGTRTRRASRSPAHATPPTQHWLQALGVPTGFTGVGLVGLGCLPAPT